MPEHFKGVKDPEEFRSAIAYVIGNLFVNLDIPFHLSGIPHPFGVSCGIRGSDQDTAFHMSFRTAAVSGFQIQGMIIRNGYLFPWKKPVKLSFGLALETGIDHTVRRASAFTLCARIIPDNHRFVLGQRRITKKEQVFPA